MLLLMASSRTFCMHQNLLLFHCSDLVALTEQIFLTYWVKSMYSYFADQSLFQTMAEELMEGSFDVAEFLLEHEGDINKPDSDEVTCLMKAAQDTKLCRSLIHRGAGHWWEHGSSLRRRMGWMGQCKTHARARCGSWNEKQTRRWRSTGCQPSRQSVHGRGTDLTNPTSDLPARLNPINWWECFSSASTISARHSSSGWTHFVCESVRTILILTRRHPTPCTSPSRRQWCICRGGGCGGWTPTVTSIYL